MKHKILNQQKSSKNCFICGVDNNLGVKVRFFETENEELVALFTPKNEHQSYPGRVHGGVSSAILDETIGRAICIGSEKMIWGVTSELTVRYRHVVPIGVELKAIARITLKRGRYFEGEGEILLPDGRIAVSAKGKYIIVPEDKIVDDNFLDGEWGLDMPGDSIDSIDL